ncbi:MAG: sodium:calcium antiporter [Halobacteriovoraceae bacterium]|nr:sodium:calcium antiporter [Halobacteriovoraceae bacterium]|tara:strand:- start:1110 stop:2072 length:963 start_codon:yes stop_codon:yes gene_type:complete
MMFSIILALAGLILLIIGGETVVKSSSRLAESFGVSPLVIGLTVVAFGTSAPELGVSLMATLEGSADLAVTNVVGSNIFNLAFILGVCALVAPLVVHLQLLKWDIPIAILATFILTLMCLDNVITKVESVGLVLSLIFYTVWLVRSSVKESKDFDVKLSTTKELTRSVKSRIYMFGLFSVGIAILVFGSKILVQGASDLALRAGVPESIIGLMLVAAGTSFPELISSIMATIRGNTDIAIGNVIGSNIFNILFILGSSTFFSENGLSISENVGNYDLPVLLTLSVISFPLLLSGKKIVRWEGAFLLLFYIGYTGHLFYRL